MLFISLNLEYYDEWKDNDLFIKDVMEMLDNALTIFIEKAPPTISRAVNSAKKERSIGIGVLGFHSFLQQKNIPFESDEAAKINIDIFTKLRSEIDTFNLFLDLLEDLQKMPRVLDADFVIQWLLLRQQLLLLLWEIHHQVLNLSELIHTDKLLYLDLF